MATGNDRMILADTDADVKVEAKAARRSVVHTERPIFVVGVHRSGTTLLRVVLNSSERIYIPPESDFIPRFFGRRPTAELGEGRVARLLRTIFQRYRLVKEWQGPAPDPGQFWKAMAHHTPAGFLDTLYGTYAGQFGAVRWGDKTPIYTSYLDLIHEMFPQVQFVHIIRDGRDVALSMMDKWGGQKAHVDIYYAARSWQRRIRQARASAARLAQDQYLEMRYESLVEDPEGEVQRLCQYLGEPYSREMAQPQRLGQQMFPSGDFHAAVRQPPSTSRRGRWRAEMTERDQRLFTKVAGGLLSELGYELPELGPVRAGGALRYWYLSLKYAVLQAGRRVLQAARLFPPN